jgi:hypothetical protein
LSGALEAHFLKYLKTTSRRMAPENTEKLFCPAAYFARNDAAAVYPYEIRCNTEDVSNVG